MLNRFIEAEADRKVLPCFLLQVMRFNQPVHTQFIGLHLLPFSLRQSQIILRVFESHALCLFKLASWSLGFYQTVCNVDLCYRHAVNLWSCFCLYVCELYMAVVDVPLGLIVSPPLKRTFADHPLSSTNCDVIKIFPVVYYECHRFMLLNVRARLCLVDLAIDITLHFFCEKALHFLFSSPGFEQSALKVHHRHQWADQCLTVVRYIVQISHLAAV